MDGQIFISYRRDDTAASAGRIYDRLDSQLASNHIFMDVDKIDPGVDFIDAIEKSVASCDALIAVIGRHWLIAADAEGKRRVDNPGDFVRIEIATALKRSVPVIPVLVDGATLPRSNELPDDLKPLARRQALEIRHERFDDDCRQLIAALQRVSVGQEKRAALQAEQKEKESKKRRGPMIVTISAGLVILAVAVLVTLKRQETKPRDDAYAPGTAAPEASIAPIPSSTPVIATSARIEPAKTLPSLAGSTAAATKENPFVNSLGMRFVPVAGTNVLFSVWETRVKDYQAFCDDTGRSWDKPRFRQTPEHPAANVSWEDAKAFCEWLSGREGKSYRLPTDHEWSCAVGIGDQENADATPRAKKKKIADEYPWGEQWPPANDAGNYFGEECKTAEGLARLRAAGYEDASSWPALEGFNDGKLFTAAAGDFRPNGLGIYDLGGNVWEWCQDEYEPGSGSRVLRGSSWLFYDRVIMLSSIRNYEPSDYRFGAVGFRPVVEGGSGL